MTLHFPLDEQRLMIPQALINDLDLITSPGGTIGNLQIFLYITSL